VTHFRRQRVSVEPSNLIIQPSVDDVDKYRVARLGETAMEISPAHDDLMHGRRRFEVVVDGWRFEVTTEPADRAELRERASRAAEQAGAGSDSTLRAQIPGRITRVWIADGEVVEQGQRLLAVEAMKMENEIRAPHAGTVRNLRLMTGARVERGDELLTVAAD
jgi:biotin carboxyl carrier protein